MASTARRYDNRAQEFVDAGTFWVDVECWNDLSGNVSGSVSKGDPLIVHGTLTTHSWDSDNGRRSTPRIRAFAVGPNLARGTAEFRRSRSARPGEPADAAADGPLSPSAASAEDAFPALSAVPVSGRDYVEDPSALHDVTAEDLTAEPAHV
jgi:single-strand DNA-binding protein